MPSATEERSEVLSLERARAERFLDKLASNPFVTIIVEGGKVMFYVRTDLGQEHLTLIRAHIDKLLSEED